MVRLPNALLRSQLDENGELSPTELESSGDLEERMRGLMPAIDIPKYIRQLDIFRFNKDDLEVIGEAAGPDLYHPPTVQAKDGKVYL
jgi:hypothetical protein